MFEVEVLASAHAAGAIVVDVREPCVGYDAYSVAGGMWAWQNNARNDDHGVPTQNSQEAL